MTNASLFLFTLVLAAGFSTFISWSYSRPWGSGKWLKKIFRPFFLQGLATALASSTNLVIAHTSHEWEVWTVMAIFAITFLGGGVATFIANMHFLPKCDYNRE